MEIRQITFKFTKRYPMGLNARNYDDEVKELIEISAKVGGLVYSNQIEKYSTHEPLFPALKWVSSNTSMQED